MKAKQQQQKYTRPQQGHLESRSKVKATSWSIWMLCEITYTLSHDIKVEYLVKTLLSELYFLAYPNWDMVLHKNILFSCCFFSYGMKKNLCIMYCCFRCKPAPLLANMPGNFTFCEKDSAEWLKIKYVDILLFTVLYHTSYVNAGFWLDVTCKHRIYGACKVYMGQELLFSKHWGPTHLLMLWKGEI